MIQIPDKLKTQAHPGVAITEYGLLFGLVALMGVAGLAMLGDATHNLVAQTGNALSHLGFGFITSMEDSVPAVATTKLATAQSIDEAPSSPLSLKGSGYLNMVIDPATGQPSLKSVAGSSGVNVNVSSVDGSRFNTLGSIMLASKLDALAAEQTDPKLQTYYSQLAKYAYYMGGAEGVMDNVSEVAWGNVQQGHIDPATGKYQTYSLGDGLRDINSYQQQFQNLLANPPANLNAQEFKQVMPYAADVSNIAQNYLNNFKQFIGPDGQVTQNFGDPAQCHPVLLNGGCDLGKPGPGAAISDVANVVADPLGGHEMAGVSYDSLVSLAQLKINANQLLVDHNVKDFPVVTTFSDAKTVDSHSNSTVVP